MREGYRVSAATTSHSEEEATLAAELHIVVGRLEVFAAQVKSKLDEGDWLLRREVIRTLVKRVEVDHEQVRVVFRVPPDPFVPHPDQDVLPHCRRGAVATMGKHRPARIRR